MLVLVLLVAQIILGLDLFEYPHLDWLFALLDNPGPVILAIKLIAGLAIFLLGTVDEFFIEVDVDEVHFQHDLLGLLLFGLVYIGSCCLQLDELYEILADPFPENVVAGHRH